MTTNNKLPNSLLADITINLIGAAQAIDGFGVPLIVDTENVQSAGAGSPVVTKCFSLQDVTDLGYKSWNKVTKLATAMLAQSKRVKSFYVASVNALSSAELTAVEAAASDWYAMLLTSRASADIQTCATWTDTVATRRHLFFAESQDTACFTGGPSVLSILEAANRLRTVPFARKANAQAQTLTISAAFVALNSVTVKVNGTSIAAPVVFAVDSDSTLQALAAAISAVGGGLICSATVTTVAGGTDNDRVITVTALDPLVNVVLSDYACTLGVSQNTAAIATSNTGAIPADAASVGLLVPQGLGQSTLAGKTLTTLAADALSQSEFSAATGHGGNVYVTIGGVSQAQKGQTSGFVAAGAHAFMDTIAMRDRLESDLQAAVISTLTPQTGKLPFNNSGIAAVAHAAQNVCQRYVSLEMIEAFDPVTDWTIPDISEVSSADKTARNLPGITANLLGTGAIQSVALTVNIQV